MFVAHEKDRLRDILKQIQKKFGDDSVVRLDPKAQQYNHIPTFSTGVLTIDDITGGGLPYGRICEVFGPEGCGKTTFALHCIASVQSLGGVCLYLDTEHALDTQYAKKIKVDLSSLFLCQPDYAEQGLEIIEFMVNSQAVNFIVLDSVACLLPLTEKDSSMENPSIGSMARLVGRFLRRILPILNKDQFFCTILLINQIRNKITAFGNPETTTGGQAVKYAASIRLEMRATSPIKRNEERIGSEIQIKTLKNKIFMPYLTAYSKLFFGQGFSELDDIVCLAIKKNIISKNGNWLYFKDVKMGQGIEKTKLFLLQENDLRNEIKQNIISSLHQTSTPN